MFTFWEFFAGGGMARAALQPQGQCVFANDFDQKKSAAYRENWGDKELVTEDVGALKLKDLPTECPDLAWASFPCQDLSLAGGGAGLKGDRSGTFWPFWQLMQATHAQNRAPRIIALENVCGAITSHGGKDFRAIVEAYHELNYTVGAVVLDARHFVPQSRPRLFFIGLSQDAPIPDELIADAAQPLWHSNALIKAHDALDAKLQDNWRWWRLPTPSPRKKNLIDIVEDEPTDVRPHSPEETERLLAMMSPVHRAKIKKARLEGRRVVGTVYRRTRPNAPDGTIQRAEIRFDDIAGCLRTPAGGSSRQTLLFVDGKEHKSRLISSRETARLMGLPETYVLPERYNDAYHLTGDGVAVDAVRYLKEHIFEPLLCAMDEKPGRRKAA
jgi:DNA (cytosine-5)-methyltransferase 1